MSRADDWFLSVEERANPSATIDAGRDHAWSDGASARPVVHGAEYFACLASELRSTRGGDRVWLLDWRGDADERLDGPGSEIGRLLSDAARRGVDVRGLVWRSHPDQEKFSEEENARLAEVVNEAGGEILLDERVRRFGSHHQKLVLIRRGEGGDVAFVGGVDLCHGRNDDAKHGGDPQAIEMDPRYGRTPPWHDIQVELRGPVLDDLERSFRERWEDPAPLDHRNPVRAWIRRMVRQPGRASRLPPSPPSTPVAGELRVQVLRTYPPRRPRYPFAPEGERSIARAYLKAIGRARSLVYVEDQYLWSREVAGVLADALRRAPDLRVIAVVPRYPDRNGLLSGPMERVGQLEAIDVVRGAARERVGIYDLENEDGVPIYLHAKVCIVDDVWMTIGSDNLNLRSWSHDSEMTCAFLDPRPDDREPLDPTGRGDRARVLPRETRLELWREHLGVDMPVEDLLDPGRGFAAWQHAAETLDGWHAAGRAGPRPPGRVRRHDPEPVRWWAVGWAQALHRLAVDPDGRPRGMRRSGRF
jgi:phosphatidylserine/phosphatidylglycerophosphate/cardiolipin synthase-like enzyme